MKIAVLFSLFALTCQLQGDMVPPKLVPPELIDAFTLSGRIPISYNYKNDTAQGVNPPVYTEPQIGVNMHFLIRNKVQLYYGRTDLFLHAAMEKYGAFIKDKNVAVIGSVLPWYESYVLFYGGRPTTIEYNKIISNDPRLQILTVDEYEKNPIKFDAILSISSIEHDGLGRYGDPINPKGDLQAMEKAKSMLNEGGLLFLAVPIGKDELCWNVHRIYGKIRIPLLFNGWEYVDSFGFLMTDMDRDCNGDGSHQPIFVLRPQKAS